MNDHLYKDIILEHWKSPQNYGLIKDSDIDGVGENPYCGDRMHLTVIIKGGRVEDVGFEAEGCAISKASASLFSEEMRGKTVDELTQSKPEDVLGLLGLRLSPTREKCALLILKILEKGLKKAHFGK